MGEKVPAPDAEVEAQVQYLLQYYPQYYWQYYQTLAAKEKGKPASLPAPEDPSLPSSTTAASLAPQPQALPSLGVPQGLRTTVGSMQQVRPLGALGAMRPALAQALPVRPAVSSGMGMGQTQALHAGAYRPPMPQMSPPHPAAYHQLGAPPQQSASASTLYRAKAHGGDESVRKGEQQSQVWTPPASASGAAPRPRGPEEDWSAAAWSAAAWAGDAGKGGDYGAWTGDAGKGPKGGEYGAWSGEAAKGQKGAEWGQDWKGGAPGWGHPEPAWNTWDASWPQGGKLGPPAWGPPAWGEAEAFAGPPGGAYGYGSVKGGYGGSSGEQGKGSMTPAMAARTAGYGDAWSPASSWGAESWSEGGRAAPY